MSKKGRFFKMSIIFGGLFVQNLAFAENVILNCSNKDPNNYHGIIISDEPSSLDALGQVSYGPFRVVNVICNNAAVLVELKEDIICAGVDRARPVPHVVSEKIEYKDSGYVWNGVSCGK